MAQRTHAIIGTGTTSKKALFESLDEVFKEGDAVALVWEGPPGETVELVYDYIVDNEYEFNMFYPDGKQPAKVFRTSDVGVTQKSRNPIVAAAKAVANGGKVLVLFDDEEQDLYFNANDAAPAGTLFLDLSNGLAPIIFDEDAEEEEEEVETEKVEAEEEVEEEAFTRDELINMPAAAVKRYGVKVGAKAATKSGIIDELFPEDDEEEEADEPAPLKAGDKVPKPDLPSFPKNSNEEDAWVKLERSLTNVTPSKEAIVRIEALRESFKGTGALILAFAPFGRERALAITKLEEAAMWAVKAIVLGEDES